MRALGAMLQPTQRVPALLHSPKNSSEACAAARAACAHLFALSEEFYWGVCCSQVSVCPPYCTPRKIPLGGMLQPGQRAPNFLHSQKNSSGGYAAARAACA